MKSVGEVAIIVGADIGPMNRELKKAEGSLSRFERSAVSMARGLGSAMGIGAIGVGSVATAMVGLTRASMQNIDALSKQARAVGVSVASFQAMSLVANEAGVETDALSKMLIKMQDNIAGLAIGSKAQVDSFERLGISMSDLSGLNADEQFKKIVSAMAAIKDPTEKTAAALDVFGKSGAVALNMLDGYAGAVENAAAFQERFGIAVSDTDAQNIEKANDAIGRMGEAFRGLGNVLAAEAAPAIAGFAEGVTEIVGNALSAETALGNLIGSVEKAKAIFGEDVFAAMVKSRGLIEENSSEILSLKANFEDVARTVATTTSSMSGDIGALMDAGVYDLAFQIEDVVTQMDQLSIAYQNGTIEGEEFNRKMAEATAEAIRLLEEANKIDGIDVSGAISMIGGLLGRITAAANEAARLRGLLPGGGADYAALPDDRAAAISESRSGQGGFGGEMTTSPRPRQAPVGDAFLGDPASSGSGGGLADQFARRLETIVASLQTEREVIDAWYQENLALLQQASDAELQALGGKHQALERLEEEHQRRLADIRDTGNQWSLDSALSGGAEVLGAMGAFNKKALKLQAVVSAGQALISTYEGAAKELRKGTFGFASAAAVIAKGLGFVAAIRSAANGGSGGGGGGGARGGAVEQQPTQTMNFTITNDPFGFGERFARQIAAQINEAQRNGINMRANVLT